MREGQEAADSKDRRAEKISRDLMSVRDHDFAERTSLSEQLGRLRAEVIKWEDEELPSLKGERKKLEEDLLDRLRKVKIEDLDKAEPVPERTEDAPEDE
jgi:hypothetical protein